MAMAKKRQVFFNSNANGIDMLSVAVYSLLKNSDPNQPLSIFIAHDGTFADQHGKERIDDIVIRFPFASTHYLDFTPCQRKYGQAFTEILWAFPLCEKLLPAEITGNLVYLDIDMLIMADLAPLYELDLASKGMIAAAVNESRREHRQYLIDAGWPEAAGYSFNNATTVIDLAAFRAAHATERMIEWFRAHQKTAINLDQDAQNVIYGDKTLRLPPKWNYTDGWLERILRLNPFAREWRVFKPADMLEAILAPCIIHYIGRRKPTRWTHRPERLVYKRAMGELGMLEHGRLPGETLGKVIVGFGFDAYHRLLKWYARLLKALRG